MRPTRIACFLALATLLTLGSSVQAGVALPIPTAVSIPAGDDGWTTTADNGTFLDYSLNPIPADFFGLGSDPFTQKLFLHGAPLANNGGLVWSTDTIVRRLAPTGLMSVGSCSPVIPIDFQALHVESNPFTVTYGGVAVETWKIVGGLSTAVAQPIGGMTICRDCTDGGTFSASLHAYFLLRYIRLSPLPTIELQQDCGLGDCPEVIFQTTGKNWTLVGGPAGFDPASFGIDPLPGGVQIDVDADGIVDSATTIGRTSFQGGINICTSGGGGGGAPECAVVDHVANDTGPKDHSKSSHSNYAAGGDSDGNGIPDHCECVDENADGFDDATGEPCAVPTEEVPTEG